MESTSPPLLHLLMVELRLGRGATLGFFHDHALQAYLHDRLSTVRAFPRSARIWASESSRVAYQPGARYRFGIAQIVGEAPSAWDWAVALQRPPQRHFAKTAGAPFGAGTALHAIHDVLRGRALRPGEDPLPFTLADLAAASAALAGETTLTFRFRSPLRILRPPISTKDVVFDGEEFDPETFLSRCQRAVTEAFPAFDPEALQPMPEALVRDNAMFRADASHARKRIAASKGFITFDFRDPLPPAWATTLVLAGILGVGQAATMGLGRFTVDGAQLPPGWPPEPAQTHLAAAAAHDNMQRALDRMSRAGKTPGIDDVDRGTFLETFSTRAATLSRQLAGGEVAVDALRGILLQRPDGRLRGLAVPTMQDRFLQRCVAEVLEPAIDEQLEESAWAYRRGLCRRGAQAAVRRAHDDGYRHVVDADIRAFFDEVDWERLGRRLHAYFDEPSLVELLMRWVRAPVQYGDRTIPRDRGLPQGAVVSPYLANFFLDCFDEAIARRGFRLVRYADDFVVLCRSAEEAERAHEAVQTELARLRLNLATEKTEKTSFERGFSFLGFLFCRGVVIEQSGKARAGRVEEADWREAAALAPEQLGASGWLAELLDREREASAEDEAGRWHAPLAGGGKERRSIYVVEQAARVTGSRRGVRVWRGKELVAEVAWEHVGEVAIVGGHRVDGSLYQQAMRRRVPVSVYSRYGEPIGMVLPERARGPSPLSLRQWRWIEQPGAPLAVAQSLVEAKIHNLRLVARRQRGDNEPLRERLHEAARAVLRTSTVDRLRGIEGAAARDYFAAFGRWVDADWAFSGRTGRGASDPLNAVLNLLYTLLYRRCWLAALQSGLDPGCGVLHQGRGRYAALAADLQEPFRFLCDRVVLDLVHRHRIHPEQFTRHEKDGLRVKIGEEAMRLCISEWERVLDLEVTAVGERTSYRRHILQQAQRLARVVDGERADIQAFRLKW